MRMRRLASGWAVGLAGLIGAGVGSAPAQDPGSGPGPRFVFQGHAERVESLAYSQDGKLLASGSTDLYVRIWDMETGRLALFHHPEGDVAAELKIGVPVDVLVFAPDQPLDPLRLGARKSAPPRKLAVIGADRSFTLWDVSSGRILSRLGSGVKPIVDVSFDAQGRMLATASWDAQAGSRLWEVSSGTTRSIASAFVPLPRSVSMAPGGRLIAWGDFNGLVTIRDVVHHEVTAAIRGHADTVWTTSFSPDGKLLATGGGAGWVRTWDVEDGSPRGAVMAHPGGVRFLTFSPDGRSLATAGVDRTVKVWDLANFPEASEPPKVPPPNPEPPAEGPAN